MSNLEFIKKRLKEFNDLKAVLVREVRQEFPDLLESIFNRSSKINSIGWTQYTPNWNDGDDTYFSVRINGPDYLYVNRVWMEDNEVEAEDNWFNEKIWNGSEYVQNPNFDATEYGLLVEAVDILKTVDTKMYEELFGDHCLVTIGRDKTVSVEEYEHD